jgi:hypothetical protein
LRSGGGGEEGEGGGTADIKSNNPHVAGGEYAEENLRFWFWNGLNTARVLQKKCNIFVDLFNFKVYAYIVNKVDAWTYKRV